MIREQLTHFLKEYERETVKSARELLVREMPPLTEELFGLFESTGNRLKYEEVYFARRKMLAVLGMRAIMGLEDPEKNQDYLRRLEGVIADICGEECWALPAHVDRLHDPKWRVTVDLFASETAQTLSDLLECLGDALSCSIREEIRDNIERRIFTPFFSSEVPYGSWEGAEHNWNAVCAGSIGSACLHLMKDQPERLEKCLKRLVGSLIYYIKGFTEDGACMEGLGYYYYGMTYFVNFAQELYDATKGQRDLFCGKWEDLAGGKEDRRYRIAYFPVKCFFPDGKSLSFSDGETDGWFRAGVNCALAMHYGEPSMEESVAAGFFPDMSRAAGLHSDSCYRFAALKMDLTMTRRLIALLCSSDRGEELSDVKSEVHILPSAQWYIAHSEAGMSFACKGGHNAEPHNHNDLGHFIYEGKGEMFLTDLGAGEYTKDYFSENRYQILCNNSLGHSVLLINGKEQESGENYRCGRFSADAGGCVRMELRDAYPEGLLGGFRREFRFDRISGKLSVADHITFSHPQDGQKVTENLITQIPPVVTDSGVLLKTEKGTCILSIDQPGGRVEIREYDHSNHQGKKEKVYGIQWPVKVSGGEAVCGFSVTAEWE